MSKTPPPAPPPVTPPPPASSNLGEDFRSIIEIMSEGVAVILADGTIAMVNRSATALVGATPEQVIGHKLLELQWHAIDQDGRDIFHADHPALITLRTGQPLNNVVMGVYRLDRSIVWLSVNTRPLVRSGERNPYAVVASYTNITPHFEAFDRMKRDFVSTVSHELRTPITSIRGALGLLEGGAAGTLPDRATELVKLARNNSERLMRLVNDILDLEKIETGKLVLRLAPTDPREVVQLANLEMKQLAAQRGIVLDMSVETSTNVHADSSRVVQVLYNLLSNAVKFSDSGQSILTRAFDMGSSVRFEVIDNGMGIQVEKLDKLFKRFSQVDSSDNRQQGGTGVGLSIARAIVEQHGGKIGVESTPGVKTVFWFTIPSMSRLDE